MWYTCSAEIVQEEVLPLNLPLSMPVTGSGEEIFYTCTEVPCTSKHSRGKTFAVHQQYALCRENFRGFQPSNVSPSMSGCPVFFSGSFSIVISLPAFFREESSFK